MALTDTFVKNVKPTGAVAGDKHADVLGLYLHVKEAGDVSFVYPNPVRRVNFVPCR